MVTQISLDVVVGVMVVIVVMEELEDRIMVVDLLKPISLKRLRVLYIAYLQRSTRPSDE